MKTQVARWISRLFHPFILPIPTLFFVTYLTEGTISSALLWTGLFVAIVIVPATVFILWNVNRGHYSDRDVSNQEQRRSLYIMGGVSVALFLVVLNAADAPWVVLMSMWSMILAVVIAALVNRFFTKVSIHTIAAVGCATALVLIFPPVGWIVSLIAVALSWSRIQLQHHSIQQVLLGWIIAALCTVAVFNLYVS